MNNETTIIYNEQGTLAEKFAWWAVGTIGFGYLAFLLAAAWTPTSNLSQWMADFNQFVLVEHHFIVGVTDLTPKLVGISVMLWTAGYLYYALLVRHPYAGIEYGDASWGNAKTFSKYFANNDERNIVEVNFGKDSKPGVSEKVNTKNYWLAEGVYVNIENKLTSNLNILVIGPPGTGKSFRLARPMLSQLCGNFIVTDPKGELYQQCGQFFEDNGYEVLVLNAESEESMSNSVHFNPFPYLRYESDIMSLAQILFKATADPDASSNDAFFEQSAETLCCDLLYFMFYTTAKSEQNWTKFVELLESTAVKADAKGKIDNSDPKCILRRFEDANREWHLGKFTGGVPQEDDLKGLVDIRKFYNGAHETTSSIVASLDAHCRYMKLNCVKELLSEDDLKIDDRFGYCKKTKASSTGREYLLQISESGGIYLMVPDTGEIVVLQM